MERGGKKKRYSKQGSCLSKDTEGTHGGELGDHSCFPTTSSPDPDHIPCSALSPTHAHSRRVPLVAVAGCGPQSSGGGGSKLVVTVNKLPSQGCPWLLVSNCYKPWVSEAVRNACEHSERLSYTQLKQ